MIRIYIRDLALRCIIGIYPEERDNLQDVVINAVLECEAPEAPVSDRIEDTVDYKSINKQIIQMVEGSHFNLIETLADRIADICLQDARVQQARITVDKPGALRFARSVAVEITKTNP